MTAAERLARDNEALQRRLIDALRSVARSWGKRVYHCKLCDGWHLKTPEEERG